MDKKACSWFRCITTILIIFILLVYPVSPLFAAGATAAVHLVKYDKDGVTILREKTVDYKWMEKNLKVYGDGRTHYYHQGPIFEGDIWDPGEINNLKDKGAVKGTAVKDLCEQVGGMKVNDEVMLVSTDKWHTEFTYGNIYKPLDIQGVLALCWYNGEDASDGEQYGIGYPGNNTYHTALQMVFMAGTANSEGKYVFGNTDMKTALPQEKYQHFFEGQYPSTNGLSGKWITELRIYSGGVPKDLKIELKDQPSPAEPERTVPWVPVILGLAGVVLVAVFFCLQRKVNEK